MPKTSEKKRRGGEFYTPLPFAEKALEYIEKQLGKNWYAAGNVRLWDMAAGTGHLELHLPQEAHRYCYLSTLIKDDVQKLKETFSEANVFQYDYLNDNTLPASLQSDLDNPAIHWLIFINPPYATAQEAAMTGTSKSGVADTRIRKQMHADGLGEVSRELYTQFLYRIRHEFQNKNVLLGVFAPLKYLISNNYQKFRDNVFQCTFQSGFVFSSDNFYETSKSSHFPVAFILWNLNEHSRPETPPVVLDVLNEHAEKTGTKTVRSVRRSQFLSRWIKRPPATQIFPPFSSALTVKTGNKDVRNRVAEGFLASLMCPGNELQNQQKTALLSGPQVSAGALSVTPENFEQAVVVFAARRIPRNTWLNHVDQFLEPNRELSGDVIADCAVWSLFDNKNQTVAMKDVLYQEKIYQIRNHFYPFTLPNGKKTFVADWLSKQALPPEAQSVLDAGKKLYDFYYANQSALPLKKYKIETFDAGWRQIESVLRCAESDAAAHLLQNLHKAHDTLRKHLLKQLSDYGIIDDCSPAK